jgi:hypothetical protein
MEPERKNVRGIAQHISKAVECVCVFVRKRVTTCEPQLKRAAQLPRLLPHRLKQALWAQRKKLCGAKAATLRPIDRIVPITTQIRQTVGVSKE